ncbi:hypothetical protein ACIA8G_36760 [Lentzea sp. NPDC051213]|uniref:terpene synthase family protein n=1 Tax=Lentzea sp. NPDC051213 TaxID=3364126 RepID=UPI00379AE88F
MTDLDRVRSHSLEWAHRFGLLSENWSEQDFLDFDLPLFAALTHPHARGSVLDLLSDWYVWGWYLDDLIVDRFKRTGDIDGAREFLGAVAEGDTVVGRSLRDLLARTPRPELARHLPNAIGDGLWEVENTARSRVPDPVDYVQMRRLSGGVPWAMVLIEVGLGVEVTVPESLDWQRFADAFADVVDLHNDLVSYRRETEYEHDVNNAVVVWQVHFGLSVTEAVLRVEQLLAARTALFDELCERLATPDTMLLITAMREWLAGDLRWHAETARYRKWPLRTFAPRGLGTSATRIG